MCMGSRMWLVLLSCFICRSKSEAYLAAWLPLVRHSQIPCCAVWSQFLLLLHAWRSGETACHKTPITRRWRSGMVDQHLPRCSFGCMSQNSGCTSLTPRPQAQHRYPWIVLLQSCHAHFDFDQPGHPGLLTHGLSGRPCLSTRLKCSGIVIEAKVPLVWVVFPRRISATSSNHPCLLIRSLAVRCCSGIIRPASMVSDMSTCTTQSLRNLLGLKQA